MQVIKNIIHVQIETIENPHPKMICDKCHKYTDKNYRLKPKDEKRFYVICKKCLLKYPYLNEEAVN